MPDAQTIYELRLACHKPGCPICTIVQRAGARYIEGTFNESMLDPGIRQKLVDSRGFCYKHTWQSINLKLSDALGQAILYKDLVNNAIKKLLEFEKNGVSHLFNELDQGAICPACRIENETMERVITSMKSALSEKGFIGEFSQSSGLCVPHLIKLIPILDDQRQKVVLHHQKERMEELKSELAEFIRKSDYRFRDEIIGKEGDSYKRAADLIHGKREPIENKDIK